MKKIRVSVVIPNYNGQALLARNLPKVVQACQSWSKTDLEIIVVDDASTDNSIEFLKNNFPQVELVVHSKNQRFASTCNSGVKKARGRVIVLLNNDVVPQKDFLKPLLGHFSDNLVFGVGCKEKDTKDGGVVWSGRGVMEFKRGLMVHYRARDQNQKTTDWVCGGAGAFDRGKWLALGGMDPLFRPAYEEDRDLSYRAKKRGWKVLFEPKSVVFHHHETTNIKALGAKKMKASGFKNHFLFVWKNGSLKMLLSHLFWLPYHLTLTNWRTGGLLLLGFLSALIQLPELIIRKIKG